MAAILECVNLTKNFGSLAAVSNLNLKLESGRIIGLLGPNGSGKTTLIKMTAGLLAPNGGSLLINGMEPGVETKKIVSYLPERTYFNNSMKVSEILRFFSDFYEDFDRVKAEDMLKRLDVAPSLKFKALSKGTKEKVQLVMVMARRAKLYLLDEPIGGVDRAAWTSLRWKRSSSGCWTILYSLNTDSLLCREACLRCAPSRARAWTNYSGRYSDVRQAY